MRPRVPRVCTTGALGRVSARRAPVDEVMRVLELFETRYPDFTAKHFHEKLVCEHWLRAELQLASPELAGARQDQAGAQTRGAPPEAAAPTGGGDDAAPGRLEPRVGCGPVVGPDRDHGRCDIGGLFGLLRCRGGHDEHVPRARRGDRRKRAVLLALRRSGLALLAHGPRQAAVWTRTTRPRSAGPWRSSASS